MSTGRRAKSRSPFGLLALTVGILIIASATESHAAIRRYAVIIGNNIGESDEPELKYAESDARRVYDVLSRLGRFRPEDTMLVTGADQETVQRSLEATLERIEDDSDDSMLVVFYSGHADARALHLQGTHLELDVLRETVAKAPASVRLLMIDACRSGAVIQRKGGTAEAPFAVEVEETLGSEGMVVLTAASAGEDAQESDAIQGSFFSHHLVSGLLGAADANNDGKVVVEEAYRHAYEQTILASSRTLSGIQHPEYEYDLSGQGQVVLTKLDRGTRQGTLIVPPDIHFLVLEGDEQGRVVAEIGQKTKGRKLSLPVGRYFLRGRAPTTLLETNVTVKGKETTTANTAHMRKVEYGRLVRKGMHDNGLAVRTSVGYWLRSSVLAEGGICQGPYAAVDVDLEDITITPRVRVCFEQFDNETLSAQTNELTADIRFSRSWDLPYVVFDAGLLTGVSQFMQTFRTQGNAPSRNSQGLILGVGGGLSVDLPYGFFARASVDMLTYVMRIGNQPGEDSLETPLVISGFTGLGKNF